MIGIDPSSARSQQNHVRLPGRYQRCGIEHAGDAREAMSSRDRSKTQREHVFGAELGTDSIDVLRREPGIFQCSEGAFEGDRRRVVFGELAGLRGVVHANYRDVSKGVGQFPATYFFIIRRKFHGLAR
jgi:hypothetical protein